MTIEELEDEFYRLTAHLSALRLERAALGRITAEMEAERDGLVRARSAISRQLSLRRGEELLRDGVSPKIAAHIMGVTVEELQALVAPTPR